MKACPVCHMELSNNKHLNWGHIMRHDVSAIAWELNELLE